MRTDCAGSGRLSDVAMVQATDFGDLNDPAAFRRLNRPPVWCILIEREVSSGPVIVRDVAGQDAAQVLFTKDEDVIETLAPDGADEPLRERVLPRAVRRGQDFTDSHALHALPEHVTVDRVSIAEEVERGGVVREGVHDLLGRPRSAGMLGQVEVDDASAIVSEHDEDEEHPQARGRHREEVDGDQVQDVVGEERSPGLGRRCAPLREQSGDRSLGHLDSQFEEFAMDSGGAPEGIRRGHSCDQGADFGVDAWAALSGPAGEFGPMLAETAPPPPQNGVGG